jgi:hypothetical protein
MHGETYREQVERTQFERVGPASRRKERDAHHTSSISQLHFDPNAFIPLYIAPELELAESEPENILYG